MLIPADSEEILGLLARLRIHFPTHRMRENELEVLISDYLADMSSYPPDIIEKACAEYRRDSENMFFPKLGQLLKLMDKHWYKRLSQLKKLRILLKKSNGDENE